MDAQKEYRVLALFDFDGTITRKDTLFLFLRFVNPKNYYWYLTRQLPLLLLMKIGFVTRKKAKEGLLSRFLKGMPSEVFQEKCDQFCVQVLPSYLREEAINTIERFQKINARIYVVSASIENWIQPWCKKLTIKVIATKIEIVNGRLTGRLKGKNCNREEKVNRINSEIDLSQYSEVFAFGDSTGDIPMLQLAGKNAFYKTFNASL